MKLPYINLVKYCVYAGIAAQETIRWFKNDLGFPMDATLYTEVASDCEIPKLKENATPKEKKMREQFVEFREGLINHIKLNVGKINSITRGFGNKSIFWDLITMLSSMHFSEKATYQGILTKYNINLTKYSSLINLIFNVSDWDIFDWDAYFGYLKKASSCELESTLNVARFSSKMDLVISLELDDSVGVGVVSALKSAKTKFSSMSKLDGVIIEDLKDASTVYRNMATVYLEMRRDGIMDVEADDPLKFQTSEEKYQHISEPVFNIEDTDSKDGMKKLKEVIDLKE